MSFWNPTVYTPTNPSKTAPWTYSGPAAGANTDPRFTTPPVTVTSGPGTGISGPGSGIGSGDPNDPSNPLNPATPGSKFAPAPEPGPDVYGSGNPKAAVANDVAVARTQRDQLLAAAGQAPRPAPVADPTTIAATPGAVAGTVGPAAQAGPVNVGPAATVGGAPQVSSGTVSASQIGPAAQVTASQIAPTAGATAGQAVATGIDTKPQAEFRSGQQGLVQQLQDAAAGKAPSAAEAQLRRASDEAIKTQAGLAAGAHGTSRLTQRLLSAGNVADLQQKAALDTAQVRAQEQATARGQLGSALDSARGADIGLATTGAQLATDVSKTNAGLNTNVAISNADRDAARSMKQADLEQAAASGNAAAKNEIAQRQAELNTGATSLSEQLKLEAAKANQGATVTTSLADAAAKNRMQELQAQIDSQQGIANADQKNEMSKLQAQLTTSTNVANSAQDSETARAQGQVDLQTKVANLDADLKARGLDDAQRKMYIDSFLQSQNQALAWDTTQAGINAGKDLGPKDYLGLVKDSIKGGTDAYAASDERVKRDVKPVDADAVKNLASKLETIQWKYKGDLDDGREHFGVMAQALEKDPLGKKLVITDDADGVKKVDYQGLTALLLAAALKGKRVARGL